MKRITFNLKENQCREYIIGDDGTTIAYDSRNDEIAHFKHTYFTDFVNDIGDAREIVGVKVVFDKDEGGELARFTEGFYSGLCRGNTGLNKYDNSREFEIKTISTFVMEIVEKQYAQSND